MASGLILLFFLAFLAALFLTRARRRMGFGVSGGTWAAIIAVNAPSSNPGPGPTSMAPDSSDQTHVVPSPSTR